MHTSNYRGRQLASYQINGTFYCALLAEVKDDTKSRYTGKTLKEALGKLMCIIDGELD